MARPIGTTGGNTQTVGPPILPAPPKSQHAAVAAQHAVQHSQSVAAAYHPTVAPKPVYVPPVQGRANVYVPPASVGARTAKAPAPVGPPIITPQKRQSDTLFAMLRTAVSKPIDVHQFDINPLSHAGWTIGRSDQGVDANAAVGTPIVAPNDSVVTSVQSNWYKGQPLVALKLTNGPNKGKYWYLAEQVANLPAPGQHIPRGGTVATYAPSGTGIEIGWAADASGTTLARATSGYVEGQVTPAGTSFRNFMAHGVSGAGLNALPKNARGRVVASAAGGVANRGSSSNPIPQQNVTPTTFAVAAIKSLGIKPTPANVEAFTAWEAQEGGHWNNTAHFNPLNTTQVEPGYSQTGSQGNIGSYTSWKQGLQATKTTLQNGRYGTILDALKNGGSVSDLSNAVAGTAWGTGGVHAPGVKLSAKQVAQLSKSVKGLPATGYAGSGSTSVSSAVSSAVSSGSSGGGSNGVAGVSTRASRPDGARNGSMQIPAARAASTGATSGVDWNAIAEAVLSSQAGRPISTSGKVGSLNPLSAAANLAASGQYSTGAAPATTTTATSASAPATSGTTKGATLPKGGQQHGLVSTAALRAIGAKHGWTGAQISDWMNVVVSESNGTLTDTNSSSGAYGIAQFINGPGEYAKYGGDSHSLSGQLTAMANYIAQRYGNPSAAWAFHKAHNWY